MRAPVLVGILLVSSSGAGESAAQSGQAHCPKPGTQLTFSDGARIEAVGDQGNYVCRFRSLKTQKAFDRLFGSFTPTGPNFQQIRSLGPLEVGRKVSFTSSGAGDRGSDGFWFYEVSVERRENVVTPAGTFSAFVILYDEQARQGSHGQWQYRYWYSPDVGHTVKFEYLTLHGNPPTNYPKNWELTALKPAGPESPVARPASPAPPVPQPTSNPAKAAAAPATPVVAPPKVAVAAAAPPSPAVEPPKPAAPIPAPSSWDGAWQMDMQVTTTYGTTVGGECQTRPSIPLTFIKGSAEGPSAKLNLTGDGSISGWMKVPSLGTSMLPFIVDVSGRLENGAFTGSVSGRCIGSFTMRRQ